MFTEAVALRPPRLTSWRADAFRFLLPVLVLVLGAGFWFVAWPFFVGYALIVAAIECVLGVVIWKKFSPTQGRWPLLLMLAFGFVWAVVGGWIFHGQAGAPDSNNSLVGVLSSSELFFSIWGGAAVALAVMATLTLLVLGLVANSLRQWQNADDISYRDMFRYVYRSHLRPRTWSLAVDGGKPVGLEQNKKLFEQFGGPGWLFIYPGHAVLFHRQGTITRIAQAGWEELDTGERIRAILPLSPQRHVFKIERLLTRDRIYLDLEMNYVVEIEKVEDTRRRLSNARNEARAEYVRCQQSGASPEAVTEASDKYREARQALAQLDDDPILGEGDSRYYHSILRTVAGTAPKVKESLKAPIEAYLRDIMMAQTSEQMVDIKDEAGKSLAEKIEQRPIGQIEKQITEKISKDALNRGLVLKNFDITNVIYPKDVHEAITEEVSSVIKSRIQRRDTDDNEYKSKTEAVAMAYKTRVETAIKIRKAQAELEAAKYIVQAERTIMAGRAENYKRLIQTLRQQNLSEETIREVLSNLTLPDALAVKINQTNRGGEAPSPPSIPADLS